MRHASSMSTFCRENDIEIRKAVFKVCRSLNRCDRDLMNDIVQEVYKRLHESNFLARYNPSIAKISSYVFTIIIRTAKHHIWQETNLRKPYYKKNNRNDNRPRYIIPPNTRMDNHNEELDMIISREGMDRDYVSMIGQEPVDGLPLELKSVIEYIKKTRDNRHHSLSRRKNKNISTNGYCIVDILKLIYEGFSFNEIARMHGVTPMAISHLKNDLAEILASHGFSPV